MKNCLIMGFGRSGTSLMGGILHRAGYFLGDNLYPPRESNPWGFFENSEINGINEQILKNYDYSSLNRDVPYLGKIHSPYNPGNGQRWLSYISPDTKISLNDDLINERIRRALSAPNFAYKDPRFNYTLNVWEPFLKDDVLFVCLFRAPQITIQSVIKECNSVQYLFNFAVNADIAEQVWVNSYQHLLNKLDEFSADRFIFVHYHQLISGEMLPYLSDRLQVNLSSDFVNKNFNRTRTDLRVGAKAKNIYLKLCDLANYKESNL